MAVKSNYFIGTDDFDFEMSTSEYKSDAAQHVYVMLYLMEKGHLCH